MLTKQQYTSTKVPRLGSQCRLYWDELEHAHVLLYPEGVITLDMLATEVLKRCDGTKTLLEIIEIIRIHYPTLASESALLQLIQTAETNGWISIQEESPSKTHFPDELCEL